MSVEQAIIAAVALYGAVLSTLNHLAQRRDRRRQTETDVRVHVHHKLGVKRGMVPGSGPPGSPALEYRIVVEVINAGETDEAVKRADLETVDGRPIIEYHGRSEEDHALPPRRRVELESLRAESVLRYGESFRAVVALASGATFRSDLQTLDADLLQQTGLGR